VRYPKPIQELVHHLDSSDRLTAEVLGQALRRHPVTLDDIAAWVRFDTSSYTRNLILRQERWELRLLCWRPGQGSSFHGHGPSACAFQVVRGSAHECILGQRDRTWTPGAVVEESMPLVHQLSNQGPDPLISLHAYSPALPVDAPSSAEGPTVVVVGGGFAGAATVYHLLLRAPAALRIVLVERGPWLGRGVAYGVDSPVFSLNVPASRMSIDPERPDDFVAWSAAPEPHAFLPRALYGRYVEDALARAIRASPAKLRIARGEVQRISEAGVHLADGRTLRADGVVLATGIEPRRSPNWLSSDPRVVDAWDECALATLPREGHILVLGAGLTALDVVKLLHQRAFRGRITVLSRRGLLPRPHLTPFSHGSPMSAELLSEAPRSLRALVRWVRAHAGREVASGGHWQQAIDSLRPHLSRLWSALPPSDRARFVRHLRPYWDVLRHRAPEDSLAQVNAGAADGSLRVVAGRVLACAPRPEGLLLTLRERGGPVREERFDAVVRCLGPALESSDLEAPLLGSLLKSNAATPDPAGLGIVTHPDGRLARNGAGHLPSLFAVGALRRASAWETTSVPDISRQAKEVACALLGDILEGPSRRVTARAERVAGS
jgi:uncharacterized NAD(P)/FAD-binding protein YdhS/quercetin dioxygenase-like cupin family protein